MALLPVTEALARILKGASPTAAERITLETAGGRVLAAPLSATLTQPPFDASAMDGYAVRATDVAHLPAMLTMIGTSQAGRGFDGVVERGLCVRIFTGAPVPGGADAIVIQENTSAIGTEITVREGLPDAAHIRPRGGDFSEGATLLDAGRLLDSRAVTLAAAMGHGDVQVRRKPVVALLATGDELVSPGTVPGTDQIVASNTYGLAAMVHAAGGAPMLLGIARDTRDDLDAKIAAASDADILVTTGGASVGDHDLVSAALEARGMALDFWKIAMRPGKPMLFGRLGTQRVLGLPGNPVSSLICGRVFLVPLIRRMLGLPDQDPNRVRATLTSTLDANGPRTHYMRAVLSASPDRQRQVTPVASQDSSLMSPLVAADALIVRDIGAAAIPAGTDIDVMLMDF